MMKSAHRLDRWLASALFAIGFMLVFRGWLFTGFDGAIEVDVAVPCTYDFEVATAKYFHALDDGDIPLDFLFSGTVFYSAAGRLQAVRIPWDTESHLRMPVRIWHGLMGRYFPHSAWLRLDRDTFDRLYGFKARNTYPTWEGAIEALLRAAEQGVGERG